MIFNEVMGLHNEPKNLKHKIPCANWLCFDQVTGKCSDSFGTCTGRVEHVEKKCSVPGCTQEVTGFMRDKNYETTLYFCNEHSSK